MNLASCSCCTAIVPLEQKHCGRCGTKVTARIPASLQKTLAWLITATLLYIPANLLPIMETVSLGSSIQSTIISGIILMWQDGAYPVAIVILLASVVVPVVKIVVMFWLCYLASHTGHKRQLLSTRVYLLVDWIGRWSMVDVLVVAILAALVRFDLLMGVYPGMGAIIFATVVITTMLAAMSFDPRLLWDQRNKKRSSSVAKTQGRVAAVKKIRQLSPIWIVPVIAVAIGIWMLYYTQKNQGPVITLVTLNAEGIVAGKTQIKSRSVDIGRVESVQLSEDLSKVLVKARMDPGIEALLNEDSQLWVVKPTIGRGGVSGLNTLLSGAYIELQPGKASVQKYYYELLDSPPIAPADAPGVRVTLLSDDATALAVGDPVLYHGYAVGTVETSNFVAEKGHMTYQLFVRAPYDALVTENVRFWQASGMALDVSAQGVRVELASVATLLSGGVHFDVLDGWPVGDKVASNSEFQLFKNQKAIKEGLYTEYNEYLMFFDESIRGLTAGAPLEYKGIRIGTVAMAPYFFNMENPLDVAFKRGIPVLVRVEAGRLAGEMSLKKLAQELETAVQHGLRAVLKTGSLLTGALYIELVQTDAVIETPKVKVDVPALADADSSEKVQVATAQPPEFSSEGFVPAPFALADHAGLKIMPTAPSGLANIEQKVLQVLDKVNRLPVEDVLAQSSATLAQSEKMLKNAEQLILSLDQLVKHNAVQQLPADIQQSLVELRKTLAGFSPGSPAYERLNGNLQSMDQLLRDLQPVIKTMNSQSNSLIFNADLPKDPEPEKGN